MSPISDDIEYRIDFADVFQGVVIEVDKLLYVEAQNPLTAASAPCDDDIPANLTRANCSPSNRLRPPYRARGHSASLKTAVIEESLPCSYLFELQYATLKANGHGVSPIIGLELSDDVPYMEIDRRFGNS